LKKTAAVAVCLIIITSLASLPFVSANWLMFRSDHSHSGASSSSPALNPTPLWNFTPNTSNDSFSPDNFFATGWSDPAVVDGVVYISMSGYHTEQFGHYVLRIGWGGVFAFNALSGAQLWNLTIGSDCSSPAVVDSVVYFSTEGTIVALNATNGSQFWSYATIGAASPPTLADGVVYVGSRDGFVYALNATDGAQLWSSTIGDGASSPAVVDGVVYVGSVYDNGVYALNATTGAKLWIHSTDGGVLSGPAVVGGIVYMGTWGYKNSTYQWGTFYALNATNGKKLWNYTSNDGFGLSPAVANGVVYTSFPDGYFYALNATNGDKLWNYTTGSGYSSPAVVGSVVYFGSGDSLYALNAINGDKLWNSSGGGVSPVVADGVVYFDLGSTVYALGEPYSITPSKIFVLSPQSQTYNESSVSLVFIVDKPVNWTGYSLDAKENVSISGNTTITGLSSGLHNVTVYAEDLFGNFGASVTIVFKAEPFPILPVAVASVAVVIVVGTVLLVYFKKRKH
jgi:outer membrane protein assembly factor BamB